MPTSATLESICNLEGDPSLDAQELRSISLSIFRPFIDRKGTRQLAKFCVLGPDRLTFIVPKKKKKNQKSLIKLLA